MNNKMSRTYHLTCPWDVWIESKVPNVVEKIHLPNSSKNFARLLRAHAKRLGMRLEFASMSRHVWFMFREGT